MLTREHLVVDVTELLERPGSQEDLSFSEAVEGLALELARIPPDEPVGFDLVVEAMEDGIVVRGPVRGRYVSICRRCLTEEAHDFDFRAAEVYRRPGESWEERYDIAEGRIDLDPLVRDNVLLNLPVNPLCRDDCRGLCPRCGADLNAGPCDCPQEVDIRWGALRDLLPER